MISEVIEAKPHHVGKILQRLRAEHLGCLVGSGIERREIHREMRKVFDDSAFRRAWIVDGELAAVGGVTGSLLSPYGFVWLALSQDVIRFPLAIVREARRQLGEIMATKTELATTILADDDVALRFSAFLGFHSKHSPRLRTWRDHLRSIQTEAPRIPVKNGFALAIGYHQGLN
ncbi:MAG: hypothetical protein WCP82_06895 [Alphaproteobacteria bacterium]